MLRPFAWARCALPTLCIALGSCSQPFRDESRSSSVRPRSGDFERVPTGDGEPRLRPGPTLSMDEAIRIALSTSPTLQGAASRIEAADARAAQAGLAPNPDLTLSLEGLGAQAGGGGETILHVEQEIPLAGRLRRARRLAESERDAVEAAARAAVIASAARVARSYASAVAAEERLAQRERLAALAAELESGVTARVSAGAATEPDRVRSELASEQALLDLEGARIEAAAARSALGAAMGLESRVESDLAPLPDLVLEEADSSFLVAGALESNGDMELARLAIERARRAHELARADAAPGLVAAAGPRFSDAEGETTLDLGVGLELPLFDRNQGAIRAAVADRLSAAADLRAVQVALVGGLSEAWAEYTGARATLARLESQLIPKAERSLALAEDAYAAGKVDYLRVLDTQQVIIEVRLRAIDCRERAFHAAATLRELSGLNTPWRAEAPSHDGQEEQR